MLKKDPIQDFKNLIPTYLPFSPNSDQTLAIEKITEFIFNRDERSVFVLKGYAGTGKTNLISAFTKALPTIKWRSVLLAPTGRAAKVLSSYSQRQAQTIHKKIFRKQLDSNGAVHFSLAENLHRNTLFIVDEASMIGADSGGGSLFNSLLENLFEYIYSGDNCKLILIGDTAQLPPVGSNESPALNREYLKTAFYLNIFFYELKEVARQRLESGILLNATNLRNTIDSEDFLFPKLVCKSDVIRLSGEDLEDTLNTTISNYGEDGVIIITRSNKRANLFNQSFRNRIKLYEEDLCAGDKLMIVKNNYFWLPENNGEAGFIANGDMVEIKRILNREELYGFNFCECVISFVDYPNLPEQQVKLLTDSLYTDNPALSNEDQQKLYEAVLEDVRNEPIKGVRMSYLKTSNYYNALQVKFSYAITCHKSQGGQWPAVFIDQGFLKEENIDHGFIRWLYTAITRATEKIFLVNFSEQFFS
ncbi:ATP-dependent DNA helicase [Aurantibacillus circumpalustris]|uniref:ATP-dependent DNA helicase n=1 Tax=Aurantibacillus circumpalustris TaxID=3036359 RepID=UPI00295BAA2B|nr:AAA family ATPase [Aurantibacillus circumpalustris]